LKPNPSLPRTVVVHHRSGIGDLIWHIPYLRAIAAASRDGKVSLIARPSCRAAEVLAAESCIDEIIDFDRRPRSVEQRRGRHEGFSAQRAFVRELQARQFGRIYIFSGRPRYALLAMLAGIPERAGFGFSAIERLFLNLPPYIQRHRGAGNWVYPEVTDFCITHGLVSGPVVPQMEVLASELLVAEQDLAGLTGPRYAFSIGTSKPRNDWGSANFAALAACLAERGCSIVLLGGEAERAAAAAIVAALPARWQARVMVAAQASIQRSAALLQHCDYCVGNDTGALNMALANGVPSLGLFGASQPLTHDPRLQALSARGMDAILPAAVVARLVTLGAPGFDSGT
jgi:heptosyltransferase II